MAHADRADIGIWLVFELIAVLARTEHLALGFQFCVDFHADNWSEIHTFQSFPPILAGESQNINVFY